MQATLMAAREASISRNTNETQISVYLNLDAAATSKQDIDISTGIGFLDHVRKPKPIVGVGIC